ncbi:MAG TPA: hypothetical protein VFL96_16140 [Acidobacteriaceae bacterium]|nr:hypothetical protein [Acidobacteriaceae bacterium]
MFVVKWLTRVRIETQLSPLNPEHEKRAYQLACETLHLTSKECWKAMLFVQMRHGTPGALANEIRAEAWKHRAELKAAAKQKPPKQPRQKKAAQPDAIPAAAPSPLPEPDPPAEQVPIGREYPSSVPEIREEAANPSFAASIGVAPPQPAKPGKPLIGMRPDGAKWGAQPLGPVPMGGWQRW